MFNKMKSKQESEIFSFKSLQILSKYNYDKIKCEHIHSIQLNNCFKNNQIEHAVSFHIKNNSENLNSDTIRFKTFKIHNSLRCPIFHLFFLYFFYF